MRILAIDPGPEECGLVMFDALAQRPTVAITCSPQTARHLVAHTEADMIAVEMIASYGMAVGASVFETCVQIGRLIQSARDPDAVRLVYRQQVKLHLCGSPRAKDANIRQALIDRLGPQGTKKAPGPTYGVKSHAWAALAVAVTVADQLMGKSMPTPVAQREAA